MQNKSQLCKVYGETLLGWLRRGRPRARAGLGGPQPESLAQAHAALASSCHFPQNQE